MKIEIADSSASKIAADWLVVGAWEGNEAPQASEASSTPLSSRIRELRESGDFEGKPNEVLPLLESLGTSAKRILLVGLGKVDACQPMTLARAAGSALRAIAKKKYETVACSLLGEGSSLDASTRTIAIVTGMLIGEGGQDLYRAKKNRKPPETLLLPSGTPNDALREGIILGEAVRDAAELVNLIPADIYPESFCERARRSAEGLPIEVKVFDAKDLAREKMECILGVGRGAINEPRLLELRYNGAPKDKRVLALVGKGITFDSGGLSLKTADGMITMKCDMAGAATVVQATLVAAKLNLPVNILCLCPLAENMPGGRSFKPGDVLRARNGKTIEILNTDAEGRLVLADALSYAVDEGATHIIDLATLTGACVVALGLNVSGVMTNQEAWSQEVMEAARITGERAWPLPMFEEFDDLIKSGVADMKNTGGRWGGAITAAKLLANFVGELPWTHVDIAGPAFSEKECSYQDAGGTGHFVRTLVTLMRRFAENKSANG